jgi:hypothetical protein
MFNSLQQQCCQTNTNTFTLWNVLFLALECVFFGSIGFVQRYADVSAALFVATTLCNGFSATNLRYDRKHVRRAIDVVLTKHDVLIILMTFLHGASPNIQRPKLGIIIMRLTTTIAAAASIAVLSTSAFAGGLSPEIMETPVVEAAPAPAASSISPTYIVLGVLAALLIAAAVNQDDDETPAETRPVSEGFTGE